MKIMKKKWQWTMRKIKGLSGKLDYDWINLYFEFWIILILLMAGGFITLGFQYYDIVNEAKAKVKAYEKYDQKVYPVSYGLHSASLVYKIFQQAKPDTKEISLYKNTEHTPRYFEKWLSQKMLKAQWLWVQDQKTATGLIHLHSQPDPSNLSNPGLSTTFSYHIHVDIDEAYFDAEIQDNYSIQLHALSFDEVINRGVAISAGTFIGAIIATIAILFIASLLLIGITFITCRCTWLWGYHYRRTCVLGDSPLYYNLSKCISSLNKKGLEPRIVGFISKYKVYAKKNS